MKKISFLFAAILCLQNLSPVCAQEISGNIGVVTVHSTSLGNSNPVDGITELKMLNEKVYRRFTNIHENAINVKAHAEGDNIFVSCDLEGLKKRILYNKSGREVYSIKYFPADRLPLDVEEFLKEEFHRYTALRAMEVTNDKGSAYLVDIRYKNQCQTIRIANGRFDVYKQFNAQD